MKNSIEYIKKIAVFEFNGQLISKNINIITDWIDQNIITEYFSHKIFADLVIEICNSFSRLSEYKDYTDYFSFVIGKDNFKYYIFFSKIVTNEKLSFIDKELCLINKKTQEEIKALYKDTVIRGGLSKHSPYFLTLIYLKRKSGEDIVLNHFPFDHKSSVVQILVSFHEKLNLKRKLSGLFKEKQELAQAVFNWHQEKSFKHENELNGAIKILTAKNKLHDEKKYELLTNPKFLLNKEVRYIIKGVICDYAFYGNELLIRRGTPHFLPNTEVILCHYYPSQIKFDRRLWVRGLHRSGLLKIRTTDFKYLKDLRIEEVKNPSDETLKFIEDTGVRVFNDSNLYEYKKLVSFFKDHIADTPQQKMIDDELFINSQEFVRKLKLLIQNDQISEITEKYLSKNYEIKSRKNVRSVKVRSDRIVETFNQYFNTEVKESILNTDIETIFPTTERIIVGLIEIWIKSNNIFKINKLNVEEIHENLFHTSEEDNVKKNVKISFTEIKEVIDSNLCFQFEGEKNIENRKFIPERLPVSIDKLKIKRKAGRISYSLIHFTFEFGCNSKENDTFIIKFAYSDNKYLFYFAEEVKENEYIKIQKEIDRVNSLSLQEANELYKSILQEEGLFSKSYSLELVDLRRASKGAILYNKNTLKNNMVQIEIILQLKHK